MSGQSGEVDGELLATADEVPEANVAFGTSEDKSVLYDCELRESGVHASWAQIEKAVEDGGELRYRLQAREREAQPRTPERSVGLHMFQVSAPGPEG